MIETSKLSFENFIKCDKERVMAYYQFLVKKAKKLNNPLIIPEDIVRIMNRAERAGKFKGITFYCSTNDWAMSIALLIDVMSITDNPIQNREITRDNYFNYF